MSLPVPKDIFSCFSDRVVLITGAGGSLGSDAALLFGRYGACLVLVDNHCGRLQNLLNLLEEAGVPAGKILDVVGDVNSATVVAEFVAAAIARFGKINHLINIVGVKILGDLASSSVESFDQSFADIRITFDVSKACLPHLLATKGTVVNISSVCSMKSYPHAIGYSTAKAGLNHMSKIFAADLASQGVRVNAVCLTTVRSDYDMTSGNVQSREELEEYFKKTGSAVPLGRVAEVGEVTQTILFLCSDASSYISGVVLPIDGGYTLSERRQI